MQFDWTITIGTLIHLAVLVSAIFTLWSKVDKRLSMLEDNQERFCKTLNGLNDRTIQLMTSVTRIETKLEQLEK